ncbi:hypothetical protein Dsin_022481 [Dipteronia sinensis]|uniref:Myb/SANT-like domain-containing protein n=1 Tax=Dipteronia sinensis TaxID=43782 RepID=A0AAE0A2X3_9ROSI|nr:hypothetical protein Dsin_022481 [Dipteronia sinensis]
MSIVMISGFLEGERDYSNLKGDTGPPVYPDGFLYVSSAVQYITGGEVYPAQMEKSMNKFTSSESVGSGSRGRKEYNKVQLKNRWDTLKSDWKLWKDLVGKETGLSWNAKLKTIDASEEWWHRKLQVHHNAAKFRKEGIDPTMMEKLDRMFMNTIATGDNAWAPSSGVLPSDSSNTDTIQVESTADLDESIPVDVTQDVESVENGGNKRMVNKYNTLGVRDRKGWVGTAHDSRIFQKSIRDPASNFPKPPKGHN